MNRIPIAYSPPIAIILTIQMSAKGHKRIVKMKTSDKTNAAPADTKRIGHPSLRSNAQELIEL